jgi:hypothetical protein
VRWFRFNSGTGNYAGKVLAVVKPIIKMKTGTEKMPNENWVCFKCFAVLFGMLCAIGIIERIFDFIF